MKLPIQYRADYVMTRGKKPVAVVEVKGRSAKFGEYPMAFVAAHKRAEVLLLAQSMSIPAWILYAHPNGLYLLDMSLEPEKSWIMRDSRARDIRDIEPVVGWSTKHCIQVPDDYQKQSVA